MGAFYTSVCVVRTLSLTAGLSALIFTKKKTKKKHKSQELSLTLTNLGTYFKTYGNLCNWLLYIGEE